MRMGAATEARTTEQILSILDMKLRDFEKPPMDTFGAGNEPGQLTDDFSSAYFVARHIADHNGEVTEKVVQEALIDWSEHHVFSIGLLDQLRVLRFEDIRGKK